MNTHIPARLMGRLANGMERGGGVRTHLVPAATVDYSHATALCGAKPGRRSGGWAVTGLDGWSMATPCTRCDAKSLQFKDSAR